MTVLFVSVKNYTSNSIDGNEVFLLFPFVRIDRARLFKSLTGNDYLISQLFLYNSHSQGTIYEAYR